MENKQVVYFTSLVFGERAIKSLFYFVRRFAFRKVKSVRSAEHMRIHRYSVTAETYRTNYIRGFSSHAR